jgi:hypothetical protein
MLIVIVALIAVIGGGAAFVKARRAEKALPPPAERQLLERTVKDVRVDDVVQHNGRDWLVEGVITYDEDGHTWRAARISDRELEQWMLVGIERGSGLTVRMLQVAKGLELAGYPPETLEHETVSYKLAQRGTATATFNGAMLGLPPVPEGGSLRCRWWRYQAAGEKCLLVEQWGEQYRPLVGANVPAEDVEMLAAS